MHRVSVILLALCLATPGWAMKRSWSETSALTRASDPSAATDGVDLAGAKGFRVCVAANSGQTLSGTGSILMWVYSYEDSLWARNTELTKAVDLSGKRKQCWDFLVSTGRGRVLPAASSITVSGGTTVTVSVLVWFDQ